jgi:hypothetical protein
LAYPQEEFTLMTLERQAQKKKSRDKNNITTMQLTRGNKTRLKEIQNTLKFEKLEEALDELLSFYEDNQN